MLPALADNRNPDSLASRLRRRRLRWFVELLDDFSEPVRILDVGGTAGFWLANAPSLPKSCHFTLLNLTPVPLDGLPDAVAVTGDARNMKEFADRQFDICFSNSVIEHVGGWKDQQAMALEVRRVASAYFVQTPNRYFPIEPHFVFPFWQFLPVALRVALHRRLNLGWMPRQPDYFAARAEVLQIRLLTGAEMRQLFPDGVVVPEKLGFLTKSFMAIRRLPRRNQG